MLEQALAALWREIARAPALRTQTTVELLAALEQRRALVMRLLAGEHELPRMGAGTSYLLMDHFRTLLQAELAWLEHARNALCMGVNGQSEQG